MKNQKNQLEIHEKHGNLIIPCENYENHEKHKFHKEIMQIMNILNFKEIMTKIMKIKICDMRIYKNLLNNINSE